MQKDANDRLNSYERSLHQKSRTRPLRFLLPRAGLILLAVLITLTIAVESAYGCKGNNGGDNNGGDNNGGGNNSSSDNGGGNNGGGNNGGNNNKNDPQRVTGQVGFAVQGIQLNSVRVNPGNSPNGAATLTIKLNLQNVPPGKHKADIHQGTCPLNFTLNGQPSPFGPFTPGVTLPLGLVQPRANGTLKQTLSFQVGGTTGIPLNFLQTGNWFFCIHTGTLAQVTGNTPEEKFASLEKFLASPKGPGQVQQLVCQALNAPQGTNNVTLNF